MTSKQRRIVRPIYVAWRCSDSSMMLAWAPGYTYAPIPILHGRTISKAQGQVALDRGTLTPREIEHLTDFLNSQGPFCEPLPGPVTILPAEQAPWSDGWGFQEI